jgi:hypothetical protein
MDDSDEPKPSPVGNEHPWGGTVIHTKISEPVYNTVVTERFAWDVLDFSNAVAVHILDEFSDRISRSVDSLINSSDDSPLITDNTAFGDYFLIHTLSSAFFEASSYLLFTEPLCYKNSEKGSKIVDLYDEGGDRSWIKVRNASDPEEKRIEAVKRIRGNVKPNEYIQYLEKYLGVNPALLEVVDELYSVRGDLVHGLMNLEDMEWNKAKTTAESWEECVQALLDILHNELTIHQGLYQGLK